MAAAGTNSLKRMAQELDVDTALGTGKVELDEDGICTFKTFVDTVCGLKIGKPYNEKVVFTVSSTKAPQGANGEDEGGAVAFYEWE